MNRNLAFLVAFVVLPVIHTTAQKKLSVSVTLSPTLAHTDYRNRSLYPESDGQIVEPVYLTGSRRASGYSVGLSFLYTYAPGWSVSSGIWFQQRTIRQARQPTAGDGTVALHSRVIRFPVLLTYFSSTKRLSPYFSAGFLTDFPITSRVVVTRTAESTQYLRLRPLLYRPIFHGLLGAGIRYKLTNRYTLMAQPIWTYDFGQLGGASTHDDSFELILLTQLACSF